MPQRLQPLLHDLVTTLAAPTQVLSAQAGDLGAKAGPSAQGVWHADVRVINRATLAVDGRTPEHIATEVATDRAVFTGLLRHVGGDLSEVADPQVRLDRERRVAPGLVTERVQMSSTLPEPVSAVVSVRFASDFAGMEAVKSGGRAPEDRPPVLIDRGIARWTSDEVTAVLTLADGDLRAGPDGPGVIGSWTVKIPAGGAVAVEWSVEISDPGGAVTAAPTSGTRVDDLVGRAVARSRLGGATDPRLEPWLRRSLADLQGLRMSARAVASEWFFAAGSPWYFTLFGRDSLWAARLLLPLDPRPAVATLRTLAHFQGRGRDTASGEQPGKIMHELRRATYAYGGLSLPPVYYGTIDATPLWVVLLHEAWRAGAADEDVAALVPALEAALSWMADEGDADGDGFLEYLDESGHGLTNQGWKDSADAVRFADGSIATGPVALCEVQAYAYQAAICGADLLDAFDRPGAARWRAWAAALAERFREQFWCEDEGGAYPALALDGQKRRVDSVTSNIGHLLGTGLLDAEEERLVADRVTGPALDSGLGLRTLAGDERAYSPLSYHCGSVWPHDTAVVIAGLVRAGMAERARGLVEGLLEASLRFDRRLPELWSGEGRVGVPYPAACRPQAWSAAAAVTVSEALRHLAVP